MLSLLLFIIVLSILVFIHELGHFLAAKLFKVKVEEFAIGFPPRLFSKKIGETIYAINALPLGGYVKIKGENPDSKNDNDKDSFQSIGGIKQIIILISGVIFNIIFAWFLLVCILTIGNNKSPVPGIPEKYIVGEKTIVIAKVLENSPASKLGIQKGEELISVNNIKVKNTTDISNILKETKGTSTIITNKNTYEIMPTKERTIGIGIGEVSKVNLPIFPAIYYGFKGTVILTELLGKGVIGFFAGLFIGEASLDSVSGPVGIGKAIGEAGRDSFTSLVFITIMISISLAVMNILPFPALDGGRICIVFIEIIIRRKLNMNIVNIINTIGFALLLLLMIVVTIKDIL